MPYGARVRLCGWMMGNILCPLLGLRGKARANLDYVFPDWPPAQKDKLAKAACNNAGRSFIENYSGPDFVDRCAAGKVVGAGVAQFLAAQDQGRAVILATGHFGNYEATRAALISQGHKIGGLYRPMNNLYFNDHYVQTMRDVGEPVFPRGKPGFRQLISHLRNGGNLVLLHDQYMYEGAELSFLGLPTTTALSAAEMALKYDALLLPFYSVRRANGLDFEMIIEAPVPKSDAETMMQALNDSLEARVLENPGQWFWLHRRWKPHRDAYRAAARIGP